MTRKRKLREALLSGAEGFTLNETARLLGAEWDQEAGHVARALLRALKKGDFDPPPEWEGFDLERLINPFVPEAEKPDYGYGIQLLGDDKLLGTMLDSRTVPVPFLEEMQVGNDGDLGDRVFVPVKAIVRFCTLRKLPVPLFLVSEEHGKSDAALGEEEVYEVLAALQCKSPVQISVLANMVTEKLERIVTPQMVCFKVALKRAREQGLVKILPVGRPPKR